MAFAYDRLTEITTIADSAAALYTLASGTAYIRLIIIHNTNSTSETVVLYNVPDNAGSVGTAGVTNQFYKEDLNENDTRIIEFPVPGIKLEDVNDTIQGTTTTASKVTFQMYGGTE